MTDNKVCPSCGATLDQNVGDQCPFCGTALTGEAPAAAPVDNSGSAKTMISMRPLSKEAQFNNSAEAMDEIKKLVNEGSEAEATVIASQQFDLSPEAAKDTVEQVAEELKYSTDKTMLASRPVVPPPPPAVKAEAPYSVPPASSSPSFTPPPAAASSTPAATPSKRNNWVVGGSIGAAVFLCLCCCLPLAIYAINMMRNR